MVTMAKRSVKQIANDKRSGNMAKRRSAGTKSVKRVYMRAKARVSRSRSSGIMGKIRWGEAALAALVGYEGSSIISPVYDGLLVSHVPMNIQTDLANIGGGPSVANNQTNGINKIMGTVAVAKVAYDVVKGKSLSTSDMSLLIPFALGTMVEKETLYGTNTTVAGW